MPRVSDDEALCVLWIGNFFEPEYSDGQAMSRALEHIKALGFNAFALDSKQWQDFDEFFRSGEASPYVAMQDFAVRKGLEIGLGHMHLALYLNGDNLYAEGLRASPPIHGEQAVGPDGNLIPTYKYWSPLVQDSMAHHINGLLRVWKEGHVRLQSDTGQRFPVITMFDPWVCPSFDDEGQHRYLLWLRRRYGSIDALNKVYGTRVTDFFELQPSDFWYRPDTFKVVRNIPPFVFAEPSSTREFRVFCDNQLWRRDEYIEYFKAMGQKLPTDIYRMPILNQWKLFFASGRSEYWKSTSRALDPWLVAPHLDTVTFNTLPADSLSDPNCYVSSLEFCIARSASPSDDYVAGVSICRFIDNDVYSQVAPGEVIASAALHGAQGLHVYGYNGLDDGGSLKRMEAAKLRSVKAGIAWFKSAANAVRGKTRSKQIALLYPEWTALFAPWNLDAHFDEKADFLGWYKYLCDLGYHVDVVHSSQVHTGELEHYSVLVLPYEPFYSMDPRPELEATMEAWVEAGGLIIHGSGPTALGTRLSASPKPHRFEAISDGVFILPSAYAFETPTKGQTLVTYISGAAAVCVLSRAQGQILACGFNPGLSYNQRELPGGAEGVGIAEVYQFCILEESFLSRFLAARIEPSFIGQRGLEVARFEDVIVAVNHNPFPVLFEPAMIYGEVLDSRHLSFAVSGDVAAHSAAWWKTSKPKGVPL
jgi:hypothetical protein